MSNEKMTARSMMYSDETLRCMSGRPEFYAGYGPAEHLCGCKHLSFLFVAIKKHFGEDEALAFAESVLSMKEVTATGVLNLLYAVERNNWKPIMGTAYDVTEAIADAAKVGPICGMGAMLTAMGGFGATGEHAEQVSEGIKAGFAGHLETMGDKAVALVDKWEGVTADRPRTCNMSGDGGMWFDPPRLARC